MSLEKLMSQNPKVNPKYPKSYIIPKTWIFLKQTLPQQMNTRVSHITSFFELSYTLLTTHAIGLYEVTKKNSAL